MRVDPPTRTTWSMSEVLRPASLMAASNGPRQASTRSAVSSLNLARVSLRSRCLGPSDVAVMKGRLIWVSCTEDSSILAFSAASFRRCMAILSLRQVDALGVLELGHQPLDDLVVPVVAAELGVARGGLDLEDALADLEHRDVEGPAAEVEDEDGLVRVLLVEPVGQRGGGRLVDDAEHLEAGDLARPPWWPCAGRRRSTPGTVMTAWVTVSPRYASASLFSLPRMRAEISWAVYALPSMSTVQFVPMWRFTERMVRSGLVMAWRLATSPTSTSPVLEKPTTDGVVRPPSALGITTGSPASSTLTTELVVPRSIPTALAMFCRPSVLFSSSLASLPTAVLSLDRRCSVPTSVVYQSSLQLLCTSVAKLSPSVSRFLMVTATPVPHPV